MKRSEIKRRPLADTTLASLEPESAAYREHDGQGLYFRIKPNGGKSWELRCQNLTHLVPSTSPLTGADLSLLNVLEVLLWIA